MRILIIEDETELALLMSNFLRRQNAGDSEPKITVASNLQDGISAIESAKPEWIILDNNLPDGKGILALEKIKQNSSGSRILMMSAMTNLREEALRSGADHFLSKPVSFRDIKEILIP